MTRSFLFLQGPQSPFFRTLGLAVEQAGCFVRKVNVCGGDDFLWPSPPEVVHYCGWSATREAWPVFIAGLYDRFGTTDIVLQGDWRPLHQDAVMLARTRGLRIWVFEEGYLRPNWVTLEEGGVNGTSSLPKTPEEMLALDRKYQEEGRTVPEESHAPAGRDVRFKQAARHHIGNTLRFFKYPWFKTHRPYIVGKELLGWFPRFFRRKRRMIDSKKTWRNIVAEGTPFYFMPLQLDADSQIRRWSPFSGVLESIATVVADFVRNAPEDTLLVIKNHPLDNGLINYRKYMRAIGKANGCSNRMRFLEDGVDADKLIRRSIATVVCNSTVGLSALRMGKPVYCLGQAIYRMPGLATGAEEMPLSKFWHHPPAPDRELVDAIVRVLKISALVRGNFYSPQGIAEAVEGSLVRMGLKQA